MRIRVLHANDTRPGSDFLRGSRSAGFSLFFLGISIGLACPCRAMAQSLSSPATSQPIVGSVVRDSYVLKDVSKPFSERSIVVTPGGAALVHVSRPTMPEGAVTVSTLFRRPGRVTIRFPAGLVRNDLDRDRTPIRTYDVRPWPRAMPVEAKGNVIRAGVGNLSATLVASDVRAEAGSPVRIDLTLAGPAALAVENSPELRIRSDEDSSDRDSRSHPMLVDSTVDWGDGERMSPQRTWSFEWRAVSPGTFRVEPFRIVHLDAAGQVQTRLVSGPAILIQPRTLFRAVESAGVRRQENDFDRKTFVHRNKFTFTWLIASIFLAVAVAGCLRGFFESRRLLKWRIERALRHEMTQRQALAHWRAFARERKRIRCGVDPELDAAYDELTRRAFGPETQKPSSAIVSGTDRAVEA